MSGEPVAEVAWTPLNTTPTGWAVVGTGMSKVLTTEGLVAIGTTTLPGRIHIKGSFGIPELGVRSDVLNLEGSGGAVGLAISIDGNTGEVALQVGYFGVAAAFNLLLQPKGGGVSIGGTLLTFGANDSGGAGYRTVTIENA